MRGKALQSLDSCSHVRVESSCDPPQQPTAEAFLTDRSKSLEKSVPKSDIYGCLRHQVGFSRCWKSVCSLWAPSPAADTFCEGLPTSITEAQKLLHPFSSLGKAPLIEVVGSEQTDQKNLMKLDSCPTAAREPSYQAHTGLLSSSSYSREQAVHWTGLHIHPSLCLSSQVLSIKYWKCFLVVELVVLNPAIALIWLFWVFDKIHGRVSWTLPPYDSVRSVDKVVPRGIKGSPSLISAFQSSYSYHQGSNLHSEFYTPVKVQ